MSDLTTGEKLDILNNPVEYGRAGSGKGNNTTGGADRGTAIVKSDGKIYKVDLTDGSVIDTSGMDDGSIADLYTSA